MGQYFFKGKKGDRRDVTFFYALPWHVYQMKGFTEKISLFFDIFSGAGGV